VVDFLPIAPFSALTHSKVHSALSASNHAPQEGGDSGTVRLSGFLQD